MKLCIDPGHGGKDSGGVGIGIVGPDNLEKDEVLEIALALAHMARERDIEVMLTRTHDVFVSITTRWQMANYWGADLFLSIHTNAGGGRGIEVLYGKPQYAPMAKKLARKLAEATGWPLRRDEGGYYRPSGVGVIKNTNMPALLSESGFIDYPEENAAMDTAGWAYTIARAHLDFVCEQFGIGGGEEDEIMYLDARPVMTDDGMHRRSSTGKLMYNIPNCHISWFLNVSFEGPDGATTEVEVWANPQKDRPGTQGYGKENVGNTNAGGLHVAIKDFCKGISGEWFEVSVHSRHPITANVGRGL